MLTDSIAQQYRFRSQKLRDLVARLEQDKRLKQAHPLPSSLGCYQGRKLEMYNERIDGKLNPKSNYDFDYHCDYGHCFTESRLPRGCSNRSRCDWRHGPPRLSDVAVLFERGDASGIEFLVKSQEIWKKKKATGAITHRTEFDLKTGKVSDQAPGSKADSTPDQVGC